MSSPEQLPTASRRSPSGLELAGLVLAVLFWPAGLVLSVVALRRAEPGDRTIPLVGTVLSGLSALVTLLIGVLALVVLGPLAFYGGMSSDAAPVPEQTLAVGEPAEAGDLTVTVTGATSTPDNSRRGPLFFKEDQQRVALDLTVSNHDTEGANLWEDFSVSLVGSDGQEHWTEPCAMGPAAMGPSEVDAGETVKLQLCAFAPTSATRGSYALVSTSDQQQPSYWALPTDGARSDD